MSAPFISRKESDMQSVVEKTLQEAGIKAGDTLIVAVSGGVDSLVLLHLLRHIAERMAIRPVVCHVNHQMRAEAGEDANYVARLCDTWQIPYRIACVDVWSRVQETGESAEEAARNLRYDVLYRLSDELDEAKIVLAHHQDDQAETVLLHLLRGTGLGGLGGMRTMRERLLRPLLPFAKSELIAYATEHRLIPCEDMTNYDTAYLRNRIRHKLLPELESYQPKIRQSLCQLATLAQDEEDFLEEMTDSYWERVVRTDDRRCAIDRRLYRDLPIAMQRRLLRRAVQWVLGKVGGLSFVHGERLREMIVSAHSGSTCPLLAVGILRCEYERAVLTCEEDSPAKILARELAIGEDVVLEEVGLVLRADIREAPDAQYELCFDAEKVVFPLHIRSRRAGDILVARGRTGKKKLKKELIDCKIAILERDRIPLVCDANDTILWVVGVRRANVAQVTPDTKQYLCLKSKRR